MMTLRMIEGWPTWKKLILLAALMVPVMLWAVLTTTGGLFVVVLVYGVGVCALGGYLLRGWTWLLVPLLAMAVELAFAVPATMLDSSGGETPFSVVLEAPFWTGMPALFGAVIGVAMRWLSTAGSRVAGPRAG